MELHGLGIKVILLPLNILDLDSSTTRNGFLM
jgi:hypothetical protein